MLSPECAEEKEGARRLRLEREMLILSDAEIDHSLGATAAAGGTESVEGGVFPDPKRQRLAEKSEIVVGDDEGMEEDKEEEQKMEDIRIDTDAKEKEKMELDMDDLFRIAETGLPLSLDLSYQQNEVIMSMRRHAMDIRDEAEEEEEEEEADEKVKVILDNVEKESACVCTVNDHHVDLPTAKFFLLEPWGDDLEFSWTQINARRLDMFYKRLVPNVEFARNGPPCLFWNRVPEVDSQYVYLFTHLEKSVHFKQRSWSFYLEGSSRSIHRADYLKARDIARTLNLDKLRDEDIRQCFLDVFAEWESIAEYKLKTEYDLFLLDCRYNQNFTPKDHPPIMDSPHFDPSFQQQKFDRWMEKNCSGLQKEECQIAIRDHYEKERKEGCSRRIHYIRYKGDLAKEFGLIP